MRLSGFEGSGALRARACEGVVMERPAGGGAPKPPYKARHLGRRSTRKSRNPQRVGPQRRGVRPQREVTGGEGGRGLYGMTIFGVCQDGLLGPTPP